MKPRMTDVVLPPTFEQTASFTPGPWGFGRTSDDQRMILGDSGNGRYVCSVQIHQRPRQFGLLYEAEREANARLILETGTVAHETGLTPRQLAEQRAELLEALRNFTDGRDIAYTDALVIARDAIAKAGA